MKKYLCTKVREIITAGLTYHKFQLVRNYLMAIDTFHQIKIYQDRNFSSLQQAIGNEVFTNEI